MRFMILALMVAAVGCVDGSTDANRADAQAYRANVVQARAGGAVSAPCSSCGDLVAVVFDQPQIGECLVEGAGFLVDGPTAPSDSPALTWVADVQGRPNPLYPDLTEDGVIVRRGLLGDCEWLACIAKR